MVWSSLSQGIEPSPTAMRFPFADTILDIQKAQQPHKAHWNSQGRTKADAYN